MKIKELEKVLDSFLLCVSKKEIKENREFRKNLVKLKTLLEAQYDHKKLEAIWAIDRANSNLMCKWSNL